MIARLITIALVAACWPLWWFAGWLIEQAGLDDLDFLARLLFLFAVLGVVEPVMARVIKNPTIH